MPKPTIYDRPRIPGPRAVVLPPELAGARVIIRPRWWPLARAAESADVHRYTKDYVTALLLLNRELLAHAGRAQKA